MSIEQQPRGESEEQRQEQPQERPPEMPKTPVEQFALRIDEIAAEMREKGLEQDATIVDKMKERLDRFADTSRNLKEDVERKNKRMFSVAELRDERRTYEKLHDTIPITHRVGERGGWTYAADGTRRASFDDAEQLEGAYKESREGRETEAINFSFSDQGKTEFFRALGILKENEKMADLNDPRKETVDSRIRLSAINHDIRWPTNMKGVYLRDIKHTAGVRGENNLMNDKDEEVLSLEIHNAFLEELLEHESKEHKQERRGVVQDQRNEAQRARDLSEAEEIRRKLQGGEE